MDPVSSSITSLNIITQLRQLVVENELNSQKCKTLAESCQRLDEPLRIIQREKTEDLYAEALTQTIELLEDILAYIQDYDDKDKPAFGRMLKKLQASTHKEKFEGFEAEIDARKRDLMFQHGLVDIMMRAINRTDTNPGADRVVKKVSQMTSSVGADRQPINNADHKIELLPDNPHIRLPNNARSSGLCSVETLHDEMIQLYIREHEATKGLDTNVVNMDKMYVDLRIICIQENNVERDHSVNTPLNAHNKPSGMLTTSDVVDSVAATLRLSNLQSQTRSTVKRIHDLAANPISELTPTGTQILNSFRRNDLSEVANGNVKQQINIVSVLAPNSRSRDVLLYGSGGMGKSTLCKRLSYLWAKNLIWTESRIDFVFYLQLKNIASIPQLEQFAQLNRDQKLVRILWYGLWSKLDSLANREHLQCCERLWTQILEESRTVLFILDGYDEVPHRLHPMCEILLNACDYHPNIKVFTTSRPHVNVRRTPELVLVNSGFQSQNIEQYVFKYFGYIADPNDKEKQLQQAKALVKYLEANPKIRQLCHAPINSELVCGIWTSDSIRFQNQEFVISDLYHMMTIKLMKSYLQRRLAPDQLAKHDEVVGNIGVTSATMNHPIVMQAMRYLQALAFRGLISGNTLLSKQFIMELSDEFGEAFRSFLAYFDGIGFLAGVGVGINKDYYFIHFSYQEFLAARYIADEIVSSHGFSADCLTFMQNHKYNPKCKAVWYYAAGCIRILSMNSSSNSQSSTSLKQSTQRSSSCLTEFLSSLVSTTSRDLHGMYEIELLVLCCEEAKWSTSITPSMLNYLGSWVLGIAKLTGNRAEFLTHLAELFSQCPIAMTEVSFLDRKGLVDVVSFDAQMPPWVAGFILYAKYLFAISAVIPVLLLGIAMSPILLILLTVIWIIRCSQYSIWKEWEKALRRLPFCVAYPILTVLAVCAVVIYLYVFVISIGVGIPFVVLTVAEIGIVIVIAGASVIMLCVATCFVPLPYAIYKYLKVSAYEKTAITLLQSFKFSDPLSVKQLETTLLNSDSATKLRHIRALQPSNFDDAVVPYMKRIFRQLILDNNVEVCQAAYRSLLMFCNGKIDLSSDEHLLVFNKTLWHLCSVDPSPASEVFIGLKDLYPESVVDAATILIEDYFASRSFCQRLHVKGSEIKHIFGRSLGLNNLKPVPLVACDFCLVLRLYLEKKTGRVSRETDLLVKWIMTNTNKPESFYSYKSLVPSEYADAIAQSFSLGEIVKPEMLESLRRVDRVNSTNFRQPVLIGDKYPVHQPPHPNSIRDDQSALMGQTYIAHDEAIPRTGLYKDVDGNVRGGIPNNQTMSSGIRRLQQACGRASAIGSTDTSIGSASSRPLANTMSASDTLALSTIQNPMTHSNSASATNSNDSSRASREEVRSWLKTLATESNPTVIVQLLQKINCLDDNYDAKLHCSIAESLLSLAQICRWRRNIALYFVAYTVVYVTTLALSIFFIHFQTRTPNGDFIILLIFLGFVACEVIWWFGIGRRWSGRYYTMGNDWQYERSEDYFFSSIMIYTRATRNFPLVVLALLAYVPFYSLFCVICLVLIVVVSVVIVSMLPILVAGVLCFPKSDDSHGTTSEPQPHGQLDDLERQQKQQNHSSTSIVSFALAGITGKGCGLSKILDVLLDFNSCCGIKAYWTPFVICGCSVRNDLKILDYIQYIVSKEVYFLGVLENYPTICPFNDSNGLRSILRKNLSSHKTAIWIKADSPNKFCWYEGQVKHTFTCKNSAKLTTDLKLIRIVPNDFEFPNTVPKQEKKSSAGTSTEGQEKPKKPTAPRVNIPPPRRDLNLLRYGPTPLILVEVAAHLCFLAYNWYRSEPSNSSNATEQPPELATKSVALDELITNSLATIPTLFNEQSAKTRLFTDSEYNSIMTKLRAQSFAEIAHRFSSNTITRSRLDNISLDGFELNARFSELRPSSAADSRQSIDSDW